MPPLLLKRVRITNAAPEAAGGVHDLLIENGRIQAIGQLDVPSGTEVIEQEGLLVSPGWLDMRCLVPEPGLEQREDFRSASGAAIAGGFTDAAVLPGLHSAQESRAHMEYVHLQSQQQPVRFWPMAAATAARQGLDLTEMTDLQRAGAVAYSDGDKPLAKPEVLIRALQYAGSFGGLIIQRPEHRELSGQGTMHEGPASTKLGLRGMPALAEENMIRRDLELLAYTGGRLHFGLVSSAGSVALIREGKARGLNVTCDMAAHQLAFTDNELPPFDSMYKVNPPFRTEADREALIAGLQDGTIDAIVSDHTPHDPEGKELEFDLAEFGIMGLETAFAVAHTCLRGHLSLEELISLFTTGPRRILNLPEPRIAVGAEARLTLFHPQKTWTPAPAATVSKARNSPFYGMPLTGQVMGVITAEGFFRNPQF